MSDRGKNKTVQGGLWSEDPSREGSEIQRHTQDPRKGVSSEYSLHTKWAKPVWIHNPKRELSCGHLILFLYLKRVYDSSESVEKKLARKKLVVSRRTLQEAGVSVLLFTIISSLELCLLHRRGSMNICPMSEGPSYRPFQNADSLV